MTSIVIWTNLECAENPSLWAVGDTLVSNDTGPPLIENAAKVLCLPIVCRSPGADGWFSETHFSHTFGYCFAGSTLMGQNSYLALVPLLSNLVSDRNYVPALADVARYCLTFFSKEFDKYKLSWGPSALFEAAVFGWCHASKSLEIWHFYPDRIDGVYKMQADKVGASGFGDFLYLGAEKTLVIDRVRKALFRSTTPGNPQARAPRRVVQELIDDPAFRTIGGDQQLAIADRSGFKPYTLVKPRAIGAPEAYFSYLGMELTQETAYVGQAMVGGPAMA